MDSDIHGSKITPYIALPVFDPSELVLHAFTTRHGGLGARTGGIRTPGDWHAVARIFGIAPDRLVTMLQVHGEDVVTVTDGNYRELQGRRADAMVTDSRGIALGVETADCVPVLLLDPRTPAVGAVHAGWRSTVRQIVRKAVEKMQHAYGSDPGQMRAVIGPAIGPECYEVDEPVMGPVREAFPFWKDVADSRGNDRWSLDLVKANRLELERSGLKERNIHALGLCTACHPDRFYSFRREGRTGRMLSVIMIKP